MSEWTAKKAIGFLVASTVCTLLCALTLYGFWQRARAKKLTDPKYNIVNIMQTGPEKEALKTSFLAELLGLSQDKPISLYALNLDEAKRLLEASPLIRKADLSRIAPDTLYIEYEVRKPIAIVADLKNTGVDGEGALFPLSPFHSPKQLPEIYLGHTSFHNWHIGGERFLLALDLIRFLEDAPWKEGVRIKRIDVSNAFRESLGQREIVLQTEEELIDHEKLFIFPKTLRLSPKDYTLQLKSFFTLRKSMMEDYSRQVARAPHGGKFLPRIIDLRIPQLAFVEKG